MKIRADRFPQITPQLDAELRTTSPEMQQHMQRLHVALREWDRDQNNEFERLERMVRPKNILINGGFQVWQRGTSIANAATWVYGPDRWSFARGSGATGVTVSRQSGSDPSRYCAQVQRDSGNSSTQNVALAQCLTTENTYPLRGKRLVLRFRAMAGANYSSSASVLNASVVTGTGTDQTIWTPYTGTATLLSSNVTLTTSWQYFTLDCGIVGSTATELAAGFEYTPVGTAGVSDYFRVQEVQLIATDEGAKYQDDFYWSTFENELAACLPYYEKSFDYETAPAQNAGTTGSDWFRQWDGTGTAQYAPGVIKYKAIKRGTVTTTIYNPSAANAQFRNFTRAADWSSCALAQGTRHAFFPNGTSDVGSAAGDLILFHWTADAEL